MVTGRMAEAPAASLSTKFGRAKRTGFEYDSFRAVFFDEMSFEPRRVVRGMARFSLNRHWQSSASISGADLNFADKGQ